MKEISPELKKRILNRIYFTPLDDRHYMGDLPHEIEAVREELAAWKTHCDSCSLCLSLRELGEEAFDALDDKDRCAVGDALSQVYGDKRRAVYQERFKK